MNQAFPEGPGYLLGRTRHNQYNEENMKTNKIVRTKNRAKDLISESAFEREQQVRALATRAVGKFASLIA